MLSHFLRVLRWRKIFRRRAHAFIGHRDIKNTLIYTQLVEFGAEDQYHVKVARTLKEACELAKAGFAYFTEIEGAQVFRKRR